MVQSISIEAAVAIAVVASLIICAIIASYYTKSKTKAYIENEKTLKLANSDLEVKINAYEDIIEAQNEQISEMNEKLEDYAKLRHDYRHELLVLREFAKKGDRKELEEYLPQLKIDNEKSIVPICKNVLLNTLLNFHFSKAEKNGIELDYACVVDDISYIKAADLSVLIGNLLDNAFTATKEAEEGNRKLRIRISQPGECFVIAMGNTFGSDRKNAEDGSFLSTKEEHSGIGLGSIKEIAEKYEGTAKFAVENDMFMSYVILLKNEA